jgi:hypothetical protein
MNPQITLLLAQPQIRLAYALGSHLCPRSHLLPLRALLAVRDAAVRDRMHNVHPASRILPRQALRQHPHARPPGAVRGVVSVCAQCAQRAREDEGAALLHRCSLFRCLALREHPLRALGSKISRAPHVDAQALFEALGSFFFKGHFMRVLDVPDGELERQVVKGGMGFYFRKGALERGGGRVGLEGVQGAAVGGGGEGGGEGRVAGAGEQGHGEVAVGRGSEDARDAGGGRGAGAHQDGEPGGWHGWVWVEVGGEVDGSAVGRGKDKF